MRRTALVAAVLIISAIAAAPALANSPVDLVTGTQLPQRAHVSAETQSLGFHIGRLEIPAIDVNETIREGVSLSVIDQGVAHWAGTALGGGPGNMVLAGHRTLYSAPFYDLDLLEVGDLVYVTAFDGRRSTYRVAESLIVDPTEIWIVDQTEEPILTLFACNPKGSTTQRIVIRAELAHGLLLQFP